MVVTRKTPVAPVPTGSRTNSSQAVPRAAKPKTTSALAQSEKEKEKDQAVAANAAAATSTKPPSKSKHKNRHHKKAPKPPNGWIERLVYLSLSLLALYAFTTCPHDQSLSNPVCRSLSQYRIHVLEPYVLPPIYRALEHPSVAPYVEKAQHIERTTLRPAYKKIAPRVVAAKRVVWDRAAVPIFARYVAPQYRKHVLPQYRKHVLPRWRKHVAPHLARAAPYAAQTQRTLEHTAFVLHKTYSQKVAPAVARAYAFSKPYVIKAYAVARPHVVAAYVLAADKVVTAHRAYVYPHVVRIWEKVLELSGAGPVGSPTEQPAPVPVKEPEPTAASSDKSTEKKVASATKVEAVVTPVEVSSSSVAPSAEEVPVPTSSVEASSIVPVEAASVAPPVEASSVVPPEATPSVVPVEVSSSAVPAVETTPAAAAAESEANTAAILEELSAASIAMQSAHGMESPVVEEILADAESSAKHVQSTPTSSASVPTPISTSAEPVAEEEEDLAEEEGVFEEEVVLEEPAEDDSELLDFLDDLGITAPDAPAPVDDEPFESDIEPDADEDLQLTPAELHALQLKQAEEQEAAKVRKTREERARLEGAMTKSKETLGVMVKEKNKALRKTLVGIRKKAVARIDDPRTEVGGAVAGVRKEGDKMLAGLEGYLKKDIKVNKGGDVVERTERWESVVKRVEEKLGESIAKAQSVMQDFHVKEKAEEVEEGMAIIQSVKDACGQAQGDVGLDLSWLDDVTYLDWQVYHSIAKIGEDFQAEASAIQAGTHEHPPADPFITRLEAMQTELGALVNELVGRINTLRQQATRAFALGSIDTPPPADAPVLVEPPADGGEGDAGETQEGEAKEPTVSILPVPPVAPVEPEVLDPLPVIGKSAEQVKEAIGGLAPEHDKHDEL